MTGSDIGTWLGTLFSIIGAAIAVWQSMQAKKAAKRAEEMRDEIAVKHEHSDLSGLDGVLAAACRAMDKYGPGVGSIVRRGASSEADAASVRAFTAGMDRHREMLTKAFGRPCDDLSERVNRLLGEFGEAATEADRLAKGREIYLEITMFSGNMKQALDGKLFGKGVGLPRVRPL